MPLAACGDRDAVPRTDVARATLAHSLTPPVFTDYLELSVGGTLSVGFYTALHSAVEQGRQPMTIVVTAGQRIGRLTAVAMTGTAARTAAPSR
ncbi:hypothetical protein [Streptomyces galbus]|uniref:hypothetical protein n=1 Tax=Streptomyces galbus TaxID=33898 RepID=UPI0015833327|nr:hypothetical protein [Streptomyces galbus]